MPNPNRSGPRYEEGSLTVRYEEKSIPHHEPVELPVMLVGVPAPGLYDVDWSIGANNLATLEKGVLQLEVRHEVADQEAFTRASQLADLLFPEGD
jgi:hypothetical protein